MSRWPSAASACERFVATAGPQEPVSRLRHFGGAVSVRGRVKHEALERSRTFGAIIDRRDDCFNSNQRSLASSQSVVGEPTISLLALVSFVVLILSRLSEAALLTFRFRSVKKKLPDLRACWGMNVRAAFCGRPS